MKKPKSYSLVSIRTFFIAINLCFKNSEHVRLLKLFVKKMLSFFSIPSLSLVLFHFLIFQVYWVRIFIRASISIQVWWSLIKVVFCYFSFSFSPRNFLFRKLAIIRIDMNFYFISCESWQINHDELFSLLFISLQRKFFFCFFYSKVC